MFNRTISRSSLRAEHRRIIAMLSTCFFNMGVTWLFAFLQIIPGNVYVRTVFAVLFALFNSFQGLYVFLVYIFLTKIKYGNIRSMLKLNIGRKKESKNVSTKTNSTQLSELNLESSSLSVQSDVVIDTSDRDPDLQRYLEIDNEISNSIENIENTADNSNYLNESVNVESLNENRILEDHMHFRNESLDSEENENDDHAINKELNTEIITNIDESKFINTISSINSRSVSISEKSIIDEHVDEEAVDDLDSDENPQQQQKS